MANGAEYHKHHSVKRFLQYTFLVCTAALWLVSVVAVRAGLFTAPRTLWLFHICGVWLQGLLVCLLYARAEQPFPVLCMRRKIVLALLSAACVYFGVRAGLSAYRDWFLALYLCSVAAVFPVVWLYCETWRHREESCTGGCRKARWQIAVWLSAALLVACCIIVCRDGIMPTLDRYRYTAASLAGHIWTGTGHYAHYEATYKAALIQRVLIGDAASWETNLSQEWNSAGHGFATSFGTGGVVGLFLVLALAATYIFSFVRRNPVPEEDRGQRLLRYGLILSACGIVACLPACTGQPWLVNILLSLAAMLWYLDADLPAPKGERPMLLPRLMWLGIILFFCAIIVQFRTIRHLEKGTAALLAGRTDEALQHAETICELPYLSNDAQWIIAQAQVASDRCEDAVKTMISMSSGAENASYNCLLGLCYESMGKYREACKAYQKEMALQPACAGPRYRLMRAYYRAGYVTPALQHARHLCDMFPEDAGDGDDYVHIAREFLLYHESGHDTLFVFNDAPDASVSSNLPAQDIPVLPQTASDFLEAHISGHHSINYYWADSEGRRYPFDELDYPDMRTAVVALDEIRARSTLHPVPYVYADIDTVPADYIRRHSDTMCRLWRSVPWRTHFSQDIFLKYVLPYRVLNEPWQPWLDAYRQRFLFPAMPTSPYMVAGMIKDEARSWFTDTWNIESRTEPLPLLGPLQLLFRRQGTCGDMAVLMTYALRAQAIPATVDHAVLWATSSGSHLWTAIVGDETSYAIDMSQEKRGAFYLPREPAKVIRYTYDCQPATLAARYDKKLIPDGILQNTNYIDVTSLYWPVEKLVCDIDQDVEDSVVYACVLNDGIWQPAYWGTCGNSSVVFEQMACGAVYLPMSYRRGFLRAVGDPVVLPLEGEAFAAHPDLRHLRRICIPEKEKYLTYLPDKRYTLYYFDRQWIRIGERIPGEARELVFDQVPTGALLRLVPEYSQGKERPFTVDAHGRCHYW